MARKLHNARRVQPLRPNDCTGAKLAYIYDGTNSRCENKSGAQATFTLSTNYIDALSRSSIFPLSIYELDPRDFFHPSTSQIATIMRHSSRKSSLSALVNYLHVELHCICVSSSFAVNLHLFSDVYIYIYIFVERLHVYMYMQRERTTRAKLSNRAPHADATPGSREICSSESVER